MLKNTLKETKLLLKTFLTGTMISVLMSAAAFAATLVLRMCGQIICPHFSCLMAKDIVMEIFHIFKEHIL